MSEDDHKKVDNLLVETTFPHWKDSPIAPALTQFLQGKGFEMKNKPEKDAFFLPNTSKEYAQLSVLLATILKNLPFRNEVGVTKLMRPDAQTVINEIIEVLQGRKNWDDVRWIFEGNLEVYKNLVYPEHNLPSAICYNIDLEESGFGPTHNGVIVERFYLTTSEDQFSGVRDGFFRFNSQSMHVIFGQYKMANLRRFP